MSHTFRMSCQRHAQFKMRRVAFQGLPNVWRHRIRYPEHSKHIVSVAIGNWAVGFPKRTRGRGGGVVVLADPGSRKGGSSLLGYLFFHFIWSRLYIKKMSPEKDGGACTPDHPPSIRRGRGGGELLAPSFLRPCLALDTRWWFCYFRICLIWNTLLVYKIYI